MPLRRGALNFLGYHFERGMKVASEKSLRSLKTRFVLRRDGTQGQSLKVIVKDVNRTLRGWFEYFKHSHKVPSDR